jgi:hypothetical protein
MQEEVELLLKIYEDQASQCRHHESQRTSAVNIILAIGAAVIGLSGLSDLSPAFIPAAIFLIILGIFGALFARKHYERFKYHTMQAGKYWSKIEQLRPGAVVDLTADHEKHRKRFRFIGASSLNWFWTALPLLVSLIGVLLLSQIIGCMGGPLTWIPTTYCPQSEFR